MNEPERVTAPTLEKVRAAAASLKYHPSAAARTLRSGRTGTIALVVGDISQPFHGALAQAVAREAGGRNMTVVLHDLSHREERLVTVLENLAEQGIDAVVLSTADLLDSAPVAGAIATLTGQGIPIINSLGGLEIPNVHVLGLDHARSARTATAALLDAGARSVGLMVGNPTDSYSSQLRTGYRQALTGTSGTKAGPALEIVGNYGFEQARCAVGALLEAGTPLEGLVVANTPMALGAIRAAAEHGHPIPGELRLICCEEVGLAEYVRPTIATVAADVENCGREIMVLLDQALSGTVPVPAKILPTMRHRETFPRP